MEHDRGGIQVMEKKSEGDCSWVNTRCRALGAGARAQSFLELQAAW